MQALIEKVDVFCDEYNLSTFTKKEFRARLLNPQSLIHYRSANNKSIFQIVYECPNWNIRRYNDDTERWHHISSIATVETRDGDGILFCHDRMVVMGGCSPYLTGTIVSYCNATPFFHQIILIWAWKGGSQMGPHCSSLLKTFHLFTSCHN